MDVQAPSQAAQPGKLPEDFRGSLAADGATVRDVVTGELLSLGVDAPFPVAPNLLVHLKRENEWQRDQLRVLTKSAEKSEQAALQALRGSEQRARKLLGNLAEERQRREDAEAERGESQSMISELQEKLRQQNIRMAEMEEAGKQIKIELDATAGEAAEAWKMANSSRIEANVANRAKKEADDEMSRQRLDMHALEARAAMMRGRLNDIDAAQLLQRERQLRNAAATNISSAWRGKAHRKLAYHERREWATTIVQCGWRAYMARAEYRARIRDHRRNVTINKLTMAAGMLEAGRGWVIKMREEMEMAEKAALALEAAEEEQRLAAELLGESAGSLIGDGAGEPAAALLEDGGGAGADILAGVLAVGDREPAPEPEPEPAADLSLEDKARELAALSVLVQDEEQSAALYIQCKWRRRQILQKRHWAASKIQAAYRGYKIRKEARLIASLQTIENPDGGEPLSGLERDMAVQFGHVLVRGISRPPPGELGLIGPQGVEIYVEELEEVLTKTIESVRDPTTWTTSILQRDGPNPRIAA